MFHSANLKPPILGCITCPCSPDQAFFFRMSTPFPLKSNRSSFEEKISAQMKQTTTLFANTASMCTFKHYGSLAQMLQNLRPLLEEGFNFLDTAWPKVDTCINLRSTLDLFVFDI